LIIFQFDIGKAYIKLRLVSKNMPELPEVETVCRGLEKILVNNRFQDIILNRKNLRVPIPSNLAQDLHGKKIINIKRRAKYILITLENDIILIIHLGMSGRLTAYDTPRSNDLKHDHVIFRLDNNIELVFNDPRRFGLIEICSLPYMKEFYLFKELGPEPFDEKFSVDYLQHALKNKKQPIKTAIMDNKIVVGVGNIYACESLFRSNITPNRPASSLDKKELEILITNIRQTLNDAIRAGGSTLKDYMTVNGESGYFQNKFFVYGRDNKECFACSSPIAKIRQGGRSTFFCSKCQR
jgi:formamidopyrimidine-DNA glycosylase